MNYKGYISQKVESDEIYDLCQGEKGWVDVGDIMQIVVLAPCRFIKKVMLKFL